MIHLLYHYCCFLLGMQWNYNIKILSLYKKNLKWHSYFLLYTDIRVCCVLKSTLLDIHDLIDTQFNIISKATINNFLVFWRVIHFSNVVVTPKVIIKQLFFKYLGLHFFIRNHYLSYCKTKDIFLLFVSTLLNRLLLNGCFLAVFRILTHL